MKIKRPSSFLMSFLYILLVWVILFWPFFTKRLLPIPADIIAGIYYPWLDYKWGYEVGVPVKNPLLSDIPSILYPWRSFAIDQMKSGHIPLWNPYYFGGMPLMANFQSATFSYVNIFFLLFSKPIAWSLGVIASPLLTMLVMYAFLRHKKLSQLSSLLGAVVFSLSGFQIAWLEYNVHGHTALFLPLLLLAIDKIFEGKNRRWLFLLPFLVAFQIFAGYVPIVIYSYLICIFYILYFYFLPQFKKRKIFWKRFVLLFIFWVWGLALASIQLLPGCELIKNSIRRIDPIVQASEASYLPLLNLITFIAPDFFGNPATGNYFGKAFYDNFYLFVGTGTLVLIFYSLFFLKKEKNIQFWWFIFIFSLILIFENPLGLFLEKVLMLSGGVAARALFITDFSLAMLAALGMEKFWKFEKTDKNKIFWVVFLLVLFFVLAVLISFKIENSINRLVAQRNLVIPFIFFSLGAGVLFGFLKTKFNFFMTMFLVLVSGQLLYSARKYLPFSKKELFFPTTPVIEFLINEKNKSKEPFRVELGEVIPQNFLMPYGIETISGSDALLPKRTGEFLSVLETGQVSDKISRVHLIKNYDSPLFPLLNAKYILVKKVDEKGMFAPTGKPPSAFLNPRFKLVFEDKTVQIYQDQKYLPRAFWVYDYEIAKSAKEFVKIALSGIDFSKKVILEKEPFFTTFDTLPKISKIEWLEYLPGRLTLIAESDKPGLVFLGNSFYPGWKAYLDGKEAEIYRANYNFGAVLVGEGRHLLTLEYVPRNLVKSGMICLVAILNWFLFSAISFIKFLWERISLKNS